MNPRKTLEVKCQQSLGASLAVCLWDVELGAGPAAARDPCGHALDVEREEGSSAAGPKDPEGFSSVFPHVQTPPPAERMPAQCQRSLEFHCFKIFINVKMSLALKPRQYSRSLFAGVEVSDAEKPLSCKYKLY